MDSLIAAIQSVFRAWEALAKASTSFRVVTFEDTDKGRFLLQHVRDTERGSDSTTLAHLEIRDGKIWILTDNTEQGIANELVQLGVQKQQIVLAFYPLAVRLRGEFAAA